MVKEFDRLSETMTVLKSLPDRVLIFSASGLVLDVFGGEDASVPYSTTKLIGLNIKAIIEPSLATSFLSVIEEALRTQQIQNFTYSISPEQLSHLPDAIIPTRSQWYEGRINPLPVKYKGEDVVVWISRNITESHEQKERFQQLSEIDDLTKLLNRRSFSDRAKQCFGCRKRYNISTSIMLIDVDFFKSINDNFGHPFGDETIKEIAKLITEEIREVDSAGRLGGEEFSVILNMTELEGAHLTAERIRKRIEKHAFNFFDRSAKITVSIGVSQIYSADMDQTDVFHRADAALYQSKERGRNRVTSIGEEHP
jgi:diguanylate cyclase (GGDEF)-like protein